MRTNIRIVGAILCVLIIAGCAPRERKPLPEGWEPLPMEQVGLPPGSNDPFDRHPR